MSVRRKPRSDEYPCYTKLSEVGSVEVRGYIDDIQVGDLRYQLQSGMHRVELPMLTEFLLDTLYPEQSIPVRNRWWSDKQLLVIIAVGGYTIDRAANELDKSKNEIERMANEVVGELVGNIKQKRDTLPPMGEENSGELDMKLVFNKIIEHLEK